MKFRFIVKKKVLEKRKLFEVFDELLEKSSRFHSNLGSSKEEFECSFTLVDTHDHA